MGLKEYKEKRDFKKTSEPEAKKPLKASGKLKFVVQKHAASHLHYDFRLEVGGVLKSWAVPKGPSMNPADKRLAIQVEDHPFDYRTFEGIIPAGNYGAGTVMVWDEGTYSPLNATTKKECEKVMEEELKKGSVHIILEGTKLKGEFALVHFHGKEENQWLLMKIKDDFAISEDITDFDTSVKSNKAMDEIANKTPSSLKKKS